MNISLTSMLLLTSRSRSLSSVFAFTPTLIHTGYCHNGMKSSLSKPSGNQIGALFAESKYGKDTASTLPPFSTKEEYLDYIMEASALPKGFSVGSATGSFIPEEAPGMGSLPIKATLIHLTDGPTDQWAATFTQNKVCFYSFPKAIFTAMNFISPFLTLEKTFNDYDDKNMN